MARGGGRGGGRARNSGPVPREVQVSKKLSWLLRHGAEQEGLKIEKGGFVNLAEVLSNRKVKSLQPPVTLSEIKEIVSTNEKQRFSLRYTGKRSSPPAETSTATDHLATQASLLPDTTDPDPQNYLIRANQGHSLDLGDNATDSDLLTPLTLSSSESLPQIVVHGTRRQVWPQIQTSGGLKPMTRNHVHFATGVPALLARSLEIAPASNAASDPDQSQVAALSDKKDTPLVVSGMRETSTLLIFLDLKKALEAGLKFWRSENGVVLSGGDERGVVGMEFFEKVVEKGGKILVRDGIQLEIEGKTKK